MFLDITALPHLGSPWVYVRVTKEPQERRYTSWRHYYPGRFDYQIPSPLHIFQKKIECGMFIENNKLVRIFKGKHELVTGWVQYL